MPSVIAKWQKCGKSNCRCSEGMLHGPYFWLVAYVSKKSNDKRKGKYLWRYLGKNPVDAWKKIEKLNNRFSEKYDLQDLNIKIRKLLKDREEKSDFKTVEKVLTIEDTIMDE
ncbi:MAG: DUF6788 family protein [Promethearchaeota archaeon]